MSATSDSASAEPETNTQPSGSNGGESTTTGAGGGGGGGKPIEKTISCVSCRRRKLKCDRAKPACGTCLRLRHDCEYPERRRNLGAKRRNIKELEARLGTITAHTFIYSALTGAAQVETQLVSDSKPASTSPQDASRATAEIEWDPLGMEMNLDLNDGEMLDSFIMMQSDFGFNLSGPALAPGEVFSQELLSLGLQEPLPPQDVIDEL